MEMNVHISRRRALRSFSALGGTLLLGIGLPGCQDDGGGLYSGGDDDQQETDGAAETNQVDIRDFAYQPNEIRVDVETTVTWTQRDSATHTVTSRQEGLFSSGDLASPGDTFEATFDEPGTYEYYCEYHSSMQGTVIVEASAS